jgi:hypothetical protein
VFINTNIIKKKKNQIQTNPENGKLIYQINLIDKNEDEDDYSNQTLSTCFLQ